MAKKYFEEFEELMCEAASKLTRQEFNEFCKKIIEHLSPVLSETILD